MMTFDQWYKQSPTRLNGPTSEDLMKAKTKSQQKRIQAQKPTVHFNGNNITEPTQSGQVAGRIYGVTDHPRLGRQNIVYTSEVQKITIETRNTIYVWEKPESPRGSSVPG